MRHRTRLHVLLALLIPAAAQGAAGELFISEYVEGSSNNKAVEIFNGTGAAVDLATAGYNIQLFFNGGTSAGQTINLTGTLADGDAFVLANASSGATLLALADQTSGSLTFNGDDAVVLRRGTTVLDVIGQVGLDPGAEWGTGAASTADNTIRRKSTLCAGDTDGSNAFDPSIEWDGFAADTFGGLGAHTANCAPSTDPTDPTASASASPSVVSAGGSTLLTVQVTPGTNPTSSGVEVHADLSAIGGSPMQAFLDDGNSGDAVAGDNIYSFQATVGGSVAPGAKSLPVSVTDAQARGANATINLSIAGVYSIPEIQGAGIGSPLPAGSYVITEGIVTALRSNGYFIQSATGEEDADPATPEGIYVFTNTPPPAQAVVGNRVRVSARVSSYFRTPHGYPLPQLNWATAEVLSTGNALPPAVEIDPALLQPTSPLAGLGRYQGMRVSLPQAKVVGPTKNGAFFVTLPQTPRPVREPGIAALDVVPLPEGNNIARFDKNPERLRVEGRGLADAPLADLFVDAGVQLQGLSGVMYYEEGDFTVLMGDRSGLVETGGADIGALPLPAEGAIRIGSFNIENLSGGASTSVVRLEKLSEVFCQYLRLPDIVGLVEIANIETAQRLAQAINTNEFGDCPDNPQYQAYLLATSGSQRLAYLVRTAPVRESQPRVVVESVTQEFAADLLIKPDNSNDAVLFDRPPLYLRASVHSANGEVFPLHVVLNHTLSLLDVNDIGTRTDAWGTQGARSRGKRLQQAIKVSQLVESIQSNDPDAALVLIGDYNAFDFNDGYVDVMGIIAGTPAPADQVLAYGASAVTRPLVNLITTKPEAQRYSYVFEGNIQTLDHALVNDVVLATTEVTLRHARVNADFATDLSADPTVPLRTSDHDPLVAEMVVPRFLDADLAVDVTAPTVPLKDGQVGRFTVSVANIGPSRAIRPELTLDLDAAYDQVVSLEAPGWECTDPMVVGYSSRIFCAATEDLAAGAGSELVLDLVAVRQMVRERLAVTARATTDSKDMEAANDSDMGQVRTVGRPRFTGPDL